MGRSGLTGGVALGLALAACGSAGTKPAATGGPASAVVDPEALRAATARFARDEADALAVLAAVDPRLAARTGAPAPADVLTRVGTDAVLAEDPAGGVRGGALDLFAFRARARALGALADKLAAAKAELPETGAVGSELARPRLERELLGRIVEEERARADDEGKLGAASGDLVRAMVATWTPPATPGEVPERDAWAAKHLLEIRASLRDGAAPSGPPGIDEPLYPLERLLSPMVYAQAAAAIAQLRVGLDEERRPVPRLVAPDRVARGVQVHLGLAVDVAGLPARLRSVADRLGATITPQLAALDGATRTATLEQARHLLLVEASCPPVKDAPVRTMAPPPERAAVCGVLRALSDPSTALAGAVALHDDALLAVAAVTESTPPRAQLVSAPPSEDVDALQRTARERPVFALGPALAADVVLGGTVDTSRVTAWRDFGEAPLDVVAREITRK